MTYQGYWFYSLRDDLIYQAKNLEEEYISLTLPQEIIGPFDEERYAKEYVEKHPDASKKWHKEIEEMMRRYYP